MLWGPRKRRDLLWWLLALFKINADSLTVVAVVAPGLVLHRGAHVVTNCDQDVLGPVLLKQRETVSSSHRGLGARVVSPTVSPRHWAHQRGWAQRRFALPDALQPAACAPSAALGQGSCILPSSRSPPLSSPVSAAGRGPSSTEYM